MFKPSKVKIQFCGKERKIIECPNKTFKEYQNRLEAIQNEAMPLMDELNGFNNKINRLNKKIANIDLLIDENMDLDDRTDEDRNEVKQLLLKQEKYEDEIEEIENLLKIKNEEINEAAKELERKIDREYGYLASITLEDMTVETYMEESDLNDSLVARSIPQLYRMIISGSSQKEVDKLYKEIIKGDEEDFQGNRRVRRSNR